MLFGPDNRTKRRRKSDPFGLNQALEEEQRRAEGTSRPKIRKLRLALVLAGLSILAVISTVFGMMMAVTKDLPKLEGRYEYQAARNSVVLDTRGNKIGTLTGSRNRILVESGDISPAIKQAVVSIEDRRFYEHSGVDYRGIGRAIFADLKRQNAVQGASTITQQFVKNALQAQDQRTIFQKLREVSLAYQLERNWSKDKILTHYLNAAYFGHGAYGIESASRTYFHKKANDITAPEAALLAGIVASPALYDPARNPRDSKRRRDVVLARMHSQGFLTKGDRDLALRTAIPAANSIERPETNSKAPYFSDYITQQLVDRYGSGKTFGGGLRIRTTIDLNMQRLAEQAVNGYIAGVGPSAALVAINNKDGAIRAMVGGSNYKKQPYNLATNAQRQPGSAFKPFTLTAAFENGISPNTTFTSQPLVIKGQGGYRYKVSNYEDSYLGPTNLVNATVTSDNSVYVQLGQRVGTQKIANTARKMGIRTSLSTNIAMVLGGLKQGVTTFQMAHAYETLARGGRRISGTMAGSEGGPVAITEVKGGNGHTVDKNKTTAEQVLPRSVANQVTSILQQVVSSGTGKKAAVSGANVAGKTGTTDNHGDAWFCGYDSKLTVCIWVGYPQGPRPMLTEYGGSEVAGGTFPALIFNSFMRSAISLREDGKSKEIERLPVKPQSSNNKKSEMTTKPSSKKPAENSANNKAETDSQAQSTSNQGQSNAADDQSATPDQQDGAPSVDGGETSAPGGIKTP